MSEEEQINKLTEFYYKQFKERFREIVEILVLNVLAPKPQFDNARRYNKFQQIIKEIKKHITLHIKEDTNRLGLKVESKE
nr:MAG: hypothetical protein [uncultured archaeon]BDI55246.1 MAG: hypothetical protein [uncultured archaeon]